MGTKLSGLKKVYKTSYDIKTPSGANSKFNDFIESLGLKRRVTVAGKNAGFFDLPIMQQNGFTFEFKHRIIDVGSMYMTDFGYIPSLDEINKLNNRNVVSHNALDDCWDVVFAIRKKFKA